KEIILIAQDITRYGEDIYGQDSLYKLITKLLTISDLKWLRLMYSYPENISLELIELIAKEKRICNYLDLPIQHSSNKIRKKMYRRGSREELIELIANLRKQIPDIVLRTSLIVGFPGESKEDFADLLSFVREIKFDRLGVFKYSKEEETAAASFKGHLTDDIKTQRYNQIMQAQQEIAFNNNQKYIGQELEVIIDEINKDTALGRTQYDAPEIDNQVYIPATDFSVGEIIRANIKEAYEYDLIGELKK
ncbi:MAG: radical SAM protein, partial [bacterium]